MRIAISLCIISLFVAGCEGKPVMEEGNYITACDASGRCERFADWITTSGNPSCSELAKEGKTRQYCGSYTIEWPEGDPQAKIAQRLQNLKDEHKREKDLRDILRSSR